MVRRYSAMVLLSGPICCLTSLRALATYLTAIDVEGKTRNTVLSYRASLEDFRHVGH